MMKTSIKSCTFGALLAFSFSTYAEVVINDDRNFSVDDNTQYSIDGISVDAAEFENKAEGMIAIVKVGDDASADLSSGTANNVDAVNQIKGPVTSVSPLQVLGQDVVTTASTLFDNTTGSFSDGELLEVSGYFDDNNVVLATRIESKSSLDEWKLMTHVSAINGNIVSLGVLAVDMSNVMTSNCGQGPVVGDLVELKATPMPNFNIQNTLDTVTQFECKAATISSPDNPNTTVIAFELEGFITDKPDASTIHINGQPVLLAANVEYENGDAEDLVVGVKVEAEGSLDTSNDTFTADKISFRETRVRITAPLAVADFATEQFPLMGITGLITALTEDKDGLLATGISADTQIEARGFVDSSGNLLIDEFRSRGAADATDTRLRGPVSNLNGNSFSILGVAIDVTGATYFDANDMPISETEFFSSLSDGAQVDINHGSYDASTNTLTGGEISLEYVAGSSKMKQQSNKMAGGIGGIGLGTITRFKAPTQTTTPPTTPPTSDSGNGGGGSLPLVASLLFMALLLRRKYR